MNLELLVQSAQCRSALRQREGWSRSDIAAYQAEQLRELRKHAMRYSPFYQRRHAGLETCSLEELPVMTKASALGHFEELSTTDTLRLAEVRAHIQTMKSSDLYLGRYRVAQTSGTTGNPGVIVRDPLEWAWVLASYARAYQWATGDGKSGLRKRVAVISSNEPWHQSSLVGSSVDSRFFPVQRFDSIKPIASIVRDLNAWQPVILMTYPSMLRVLVEEHRGGRLRISPSTVISIAEVLNSETRMQVREAWSCEPFNVYATSETACIAAECTSRRLHLFDDLVITEAVDRENRAVAPGAIGTKLLVTVLFTRTQPLIRYEITDQVRRSVTPCACGLPFDCLDSVEGRDEDCLRLPASNGTLVNVHPSVFHGILTGLAIAGYHVVQNPDHIRILLVRPAATLLLSSVEARVRQAIADHGVIPETIIVESIPEPLRTITGKSPLIVRGQGTLGS